MLNGKPLDGGQQVHLPVGQGLLDHHVRVTLPERQVINHTCYKAVAQDPVRVAVVDPPLKWSMGDPPPKKAPSEYSPAFANASQKVQGFDILVLSAQALEAQALNRETAATVTASPISSP
jgi:hypothetical protein